MKRFFCAWSLLLLVLAPRIHAADEPKKKPAQPMLEGLKALKDPDPKVRYRAVQTLADLGPVAKFAVPDLRPLLEDKHPMVQIKAAEALWKIDKTPTATLLPVLLRALKHKDGGVRAAAPPVIALFGAKAAGALPALTEALKDKEFDVKLAAVTALGDLGPVAKDRAGALLDLTYEKDFFLLEPFVGAALSNLGDGAIPTLTKALDEELSDRRKVAAYALGSMGPKAAPAVDALAKSLSAKDPGVRHSAARALGKIGAKANGALPRLEKSLDDKVPAVRIEAALASWYITSNARHVGVIIKTLADESPSVRENACQALSAMKAGARDAVDPVAKLLEDKELKIRAIMTLGEIGPPAKKILTSLKRMLQDRDGDVQIASALAVFQISGDADESVKVLRSLLESDKFYTGAINALGDIGPAAIDTLPTLVELYRIEDVRTDRLALANAIKKIDPKAASKLGIK